MCLLRDMGRLEGMSTMFIMGIITGRDWRLLVIGFWICFTLYLDYTSCFPIFSDVIDVEGLRGQLPGGFGTL